MMEGYEYYFKCEGGGTLAAPLEGGEYEEIEEGEATGANGAAMTIWGAGDLGALAWEATWRETAGRKTGGGSLAG